VDEHARREVLGAANAELQSLAEKHGWGSREVANARAALIELERQTAAAAGLPYAVRVDLGVEWDTGAPTPVLLSGRRTLVAFYRRSGVAALGYDTPVARDTAHDEGVAVIEFQRARIVKIGSPNDEVLHGHPLWGSGLRFYSAHVVENSPWVRELVDINRVHSRFDPARWADVRHYVLAFHDETLECIARDAVARLEPGTMADVVRRLAREALG
jgi:hypothetical protein